MIRPYRIWKAMKKYKWWLLVFVILAIIFGPVLVTQAAGSESRSYQGVHLEELEYREVSFRNEVQDLDLAGMLFIPEGHGPFPAVVVIHGSGTSQRDNIWYLTLTGHLQRNGIAVLLPDKRGSIHSEGNWRTSSLEDLATDTLAGIEYLKRQAFVNLSKIGIVGMSQGGWIAPIVASRSTDVDFVVNVVGTSVTAYEQLQYEENNNLREMGFLPGISNLLTYPSTFILQKMTQRDFWDAVGNYDPLPYWRKTTVPVFVLYGSEDTNVPSETSRERFRPLGQANIVVKVYEGSGHALQDPIGKGKSIFREEALTDLTEFVYSVR
jgi:dienelactone hydrolase